MSEDAKTRTEPSAEPRPGSSAAPAGSEPSAAASPTDPDRTASGPTEPGSTGSGAATTGSEASGPTASGPAGSGPTEARPTGSGSGRSGSSGFLAVLLGGFIAGAVGYLAAYYTEFGLFDVDDGSQAAETMSATVERQSTRLDELEQSLASAGSVPDELRSEIGAVADQISTVAGRLDEIQADPATDAAAGAAADSLAALEDRLNALESQTGDPGVTETDASQSQQLARLTERLEELSQQVASQSQTIDAQARTIDEQQATLAEQQATLDEQSQSIAEAGTAAERETDRIATQAALSEMRAAIESGEPYADAVGAFEQASEATVPEALSGPAGEGVATLASLQDSFPEAARQALSASIGATAGNGVMERFGAFMRAQTGARSLDERQGEGPDAILSRAEARLRDGDLAAALDEIETLPEEGRQAMSDWISRARQRLEARQALADLSQSVNSI